MCHSLDIIEWVGHDMALKILMYLEDPSDLVRASAVSSSWRQFVIMNGLCKKLCLRMFPESSRFAHVVEQKNLFEIIATRADDPGQWYTLEMEHRAYASFTHCLTAFPTKECIFDVICASSTDNYPEESILNTLEPNDKVANRASYWSSRGETNPVTPEALIYKLASKICMIEEVHVHPFKAYFQFGLPIYSSKAVRFHVGHYKFMMEVESCKREDSQKNCDDNFVWTYTSPEYPMAQENCLQKFRLPEPVLCIGGILKVELLGRVQTQEMDGQYYICINHVGVVGRPLLPAFDMKILDERGNCMLKYYPESLEAELKSSCRLQRIGANLLSLEQLILNSLRGGRG